MQTRTVGCDQRGSMARVVEGRSPGTIHGTSYPAEGPQNRLIFVTQLPCCNPNKVSRTVNIIQAYKRTRGGNTMYSHKKMATYSQSVQFLPHDTTRPKRTDCRSECAGKGIPSANDIAIYLRKRYSNEMRASRYRETDMRYDVASLGGTLSCGQGCLGQPCTIYSGYLGHMPPQIQSDLQRGTNVHCRQSKIKNNK